jgi:hypothetical protein
MDNQGTKPNLVLSSERITGIPYTGILSNFGPLNNIPSLFSPFVIWPQGFNFTNIL